jgi:dipicolinate synthase subunit A
MPNKAVTGPIAIVGGDPREKTIAALAAKQCADVRIFGFPLPDPAIDGVTVSTSPRDAAQGAHALVLPLPGMKGLSVFAPQSKEPVVVDRSVLEVLAPGAKVICGHASLEFSGLAKELGLALSEYEEDLAGRIARAPAIAEGAVARIVTDTTSTIHGARIAVLGFGVIAEHVAAALAALHGVVTVFARSEAQQSAAKAAGHAVEPLSNLVNKLANFDVIVSAIPAPILNSELLKAVPDTTTVFDLASPPGSVDHSAGAALGKKVIWARGLGATSPVSVGRAQWALIEGLLRA